MFFTMPQIAFRLLKRSKHINLWRYAHQETLDIRQYIQDITETTNDSLTPEIKLRLITPNCTLWHCPAEICKVPDPFWAFYWPGGQALARYIYYQRLGILSEKNTISICSICVFFKQFCFKVYTTHALILHFYSSKGYIPL